VASEELSRLASREVEPASWEQVQTAFPG